MKTIGKQLLLYLLVGPGALACAPDSSDIPPGDDGWLPTGARTARVQQVQDGCALLLPELMEGRSLTLVLQRDGDAVEVSVPATTLPRLRAARHDRDRFRTEARQVPITAKSGLCTGRRSQHYEGRDHTMTEYHVVFMNEDDMPMGDCAGTPLPCRTLATLAIRWCPPGIDCILPR